ncbi:glycerol-3-phosphate responsive antiterminator [Bacillota bacterium Lsc_1132]
MNASKDFLNYLKEDRMIAAIKSPKNLEKFLETDLQTAFLLIGNISVIKRYVDLLKSHHRRVFLHVEKIPGISYDKEGLKFLAKFVKPDGIVSTKSSLIQFAKNEGLATIQRLFLVDTDAVNHGLDTINEIKPDALEIMPGIIPDMIHKLTKKTDIPIITGGLIENKQQIQAALDSGAMAVSTGTPLLWKKGLTTGKANKNGEIL